AGGCAFSCSTKQGKKVKFLPKQMEFPPAFASHEEEEVPTLEPQTPSATTPPCTPLPPALAFPLHTASVASPPPPRPDGHKEASVPAPPICHMVVYRR